MPRRKHIGDIWKVPYTYDDNPGKYKWRPIVIVGLRKKDNTVVGLKCSTKGDDDQLLDKTRSVVDDINNASNQNEYKYAYELIDPPAGMDESNRVLCNKEIEVKNINRNFKYIGTLKNKLDIKNIQLIYDEADRNNDIIKVTRESFFVNEAAVYDDDAGIVLSNMEEFEEDTDKGKYIFTVDASNVEYIKSILPDSYPDNIKYINLDKIINYLFYNTWVDITDEDDITDKMTDEYFARVYPNVDRKDIFPKTNTEDLNLNMTIEEVYIEMTKILIILEEKIELSLS